MNIKPFDPVKLQALYQPAVNSHKGMNGKLMVIGGSKLFHSSIFWPAQVASKIVDLVHFCSPAEENNELVRQKIKEKFWEGIVVPWEDVEGYIAEDDCILIGPGMPREEGLQAGERPTEALVNALLTKFPEKKWVVDGGALQECDPSLLNGNMIVTPHQGEWERILAKTQIPKFTIQKENEKVEKEDVQLALTQFSLCHDGLIILLKGDVDYICRGEEIMEITGGNAGLTKGGTGDVLAGLTAALYCKNDAFLSAQAASYVNKKAGEKLAKRVGVYYSAGDLAAEVPEILHQVTIRGIEK